MIRVLERRLNERLFTPRSLLVAGVVLVIVLVVAGSDLVGKVDDSAVRSQGRELFVPGTGDLASVEYPENFNECAAAGFVGIGINPEQSDIRVDFLRNRSEDESAFQRLLTESWCQDFMSVAEGYSGASEYSRNELDVWYGALRGSEIPRINWYTASATGGAANRITYQVVSEFDKTLFIAKAESLRIPRDAIEVGVWWSASLDEPPINKQSELGLELSYIHQFPAVLSEGLQVNLDLHNWSERTIRIGHGTESTMTIYVFTEDGRQVWRSGSGVIAEPGQQTELVAEQRARFTRNWQLENLAGFSVPPGRYLSRGCLEFHYDRDLTGGKLVKDELCTEDVEFVYTVE